MIDYDAVLIYIFLSTTMEELTYLETKLNKSILGEVLIPTYSRLSVMEVSRCRRNIDEADPYVQNKIKPILPKWDHICYYPMSRTSDGHDRWYSLEKHERRTLLDEHR